MSVTIPVGETYYDMMDGGLFERCVLQATTEETPNRHKAARGGTGEFYREILDDDVRAMLSTEEAEDSPRLKASVMIFVLCDGGYPKMTFLERTLCPVCDSIADHAAWCTPERRSGDAPVGHVMVTEGITLGEITKMSWGDYK